MALVSDIRDHIKSDLIISGSDYDAQIVNAIQSALRQMRGKRFWFLKITSPITLLTGAYSVSLPVTYSAPYSFEYVYQGTRRRDGYGFDYLDYDRLKREYWRTNPLVTSNPKACAVMNSTLFVDCLASDNYSIDCTFYQQDETIPTSGQSSIWFDQGYDVIRSLAMWIFKRESKGFTPSEDDGSNARYYLDQLNTQHLAREGGR